MDEVNFSFTPAEAQILVDGLSELPLKKGLAVLQKLQGQYNAATSEEKEEQEVLTEEDKK
jgi:hypothetical protein